MALSTRQIDDTRIEAERETWIDRTDPNCFSGRVYHADLEWRFDLVIDGPLWTFFVRRVGDENYWLPPLAKWTGSIPKSWAQPELIVSAADLAVHCVFAFLEDHQRWHKRAIRRIKACVTLAGHSLAFLVRRISALLSS